MNLYSKGKLPNRKVELIKLFVNKVSTEFSGLMPGFMPLENLLTFLLN